MTAVNFFHVYTGSVCIECYLHNDDISDNLTANKMPEPSLILGPVFANPRNQHLFSMLCVYNYLYR
jgi:hypothetical protein